MAKAAANEGITALSPNLPIIKRQHYQQSAKIAVNLPKSHQVQNEEEAAEITT